MKRPHDVAHPMVRFYKYLFTEAERLGIDVEALLKEKGASDSVVLPTGYTLQSMPASPSADAQDSSKWYQGVAPDGSKGCIYSSPVSAAQTIFNHKESGQWAAEGEPVTGSLMEPPPREIVTCQAEWRQKDGDPEGRE